MTLRVLFVDDEQSLLNSIKRRLGNQFQLTTANSGREALEIIESSDVFPVVCSDMRMPWMEGTEFIKKARLISPASTYIMLTGNQDQETARQALNDCEVFRFLRKPIHTSEIADTIIAAHEEFEDRLKNEKLIACDDLLAARIFDELADFAIDQDDSRRRVARGSFYELAGDVATEASEVDRAINFALMSGRLRGMDPWVALTEPPGDVRENFETGIGQMVKILLHVPRFDGAAGILFAAEKATGNVSPPESDAKSALLRFSGECLRIALCWSGLVETADATQRDARMRAVLPSISEATLRALAGQETGTPSPKASQPGKPTGEIAARSPARAGV